MPPSSPRSGWSEGHFGHLPAVAELPRTAETLRETPLLSAIWGESGFEAAFNPRTINTCWKFGIARGTSEQGREIDARFVDHAQRIGRSIGCRHSDEGSGRSAGDGTGEL